MATAQPEKKNRLSRLLGKRDKTPEPSFPPDSAYASSETPSSEAKEKSNAEIVPAEKDSDIANIDKDRNLGVKPSTGEVLDRDTGEVVTVVTTTTTTTTTTMRKPGNRDGQPEVTKDVKKEVTQSEPTGQNSPPTTTTTTSPNAPAEMPATVPTIRTQSSVPNRSSSRPMHPRASPPLPSRSPARDNRRSGDFRNSTISADDLPPPSNGHFGSSGTQHAGNYHADSPVSPQNPNFSYPSRKSHERDRYSLTTSDQPQIHGRSAMADLRAAAKGIHGVGETLRGTLNTTVDDRFPRSNPKKAAAAQEKNEAVLAKGRQEMSHIPSHDPTPQSPPNVYDRPENATTRTSDQSVPGQRVYDDDPTNDLDPTTDPELAALANGAPGDGAANREREKSRGMGKLFKRKPVASKGGELRVTNP